MSRAFIQKAAIYSYFATILLLPTQLGKHYWPNFTQVEGIRIDYLSPTLYLSDIFIIITFILFLINISFSTLKASLQLTFNKYLAIILILDIIAGIVFAISPLEGLYVFVKVLELFIFALLTKYFLKNKWIRYKVFLFLSLGALFEGILAISQFINQGSLGGVFYFFGERLINASTPGAANANINGQLILRPYGTFSHPNVLCGYLVIIATLLLFANFKKLKVRNRLFLYLLYLFLSLAILLSLGRAAIIVYAFVLLSKVIKLKRKRIAYFLILLSFILLIFIVAPILRYRFFDFALSDESVSQRLYFLNISFQMIKSHLLFGVGLGNFLPSLPSFSNSLTYQLLQPVHNIFILLLCEIGLVGFFICLYFFYQTIRYLLRNKYKGLFSSTSLLMVFMVIILLGSIDHYFLTLQQGQLLLAFVFGATFSRD